MLKLEPNPTFESEVQITVPGQEDQARIRVVWKYMPMSKLSAWEEEWKDRPTAQALGSVIVGWSEVDAPFSAQALETLCDTHPAAGGELIKAYYRSLLESRTKN